MRKALAITTTLAELEQLLPLLRALYFEAEVEGLSLVSTPEEELCHANLWVHRRLREYCPRPLPEDQPLSQTELGQAVRQACLEESPQVLIWPADSKLYQLLRGQSLAVQTEWIWQNRPEELSEIRALLEKGATAEVVSPQGAAEPRTFLSQHWERLAQAVTEGPILVQGDSQCLDDLQQRMPNLEVHREPVLDEYPLGLGLFALAGAQQPESQLSSFARCRETLLLEAVNQEIRAGHHTFCYGDYDTELPAPPASLDLRELTKGKFSVEVWGRLNFRCREAGGSTLFALTEKTQTNDWTHRYTKNVQRKLRLVFADSGNVAGSVLHHTAAINRFTEHQAWAVTRAPHPFIGPRTNDQQTFFLDHQERPDRPSEPLREVLEQADCFVFFEDDDESSPNWPFPLQDWVGEKPCVHLYIGHRVHRYTPELARPGRLILTPLPHLLNLYPQAEFYAGFPPLELLDIEPCAPASVNDGICRILHTPSLPHWTTSRYMYHKDTEALLKACRSLVRDFGSRVQVHQVAGWSHQQVLKARQLCDLTFNQLRGFHGLSGDEAMYLGRPCLQYFDRRNINRHREYWGMDVDFPWLNVDRQNLYPTLAKLVREPEWRGRLGESSRAFMENFFSPQKGILPLAFHCYRAVEGKSLETQVLKC